MSWSRAWPTEPGRYWFYGYTSRYRDRDPELELIDVHRIGGGTMMYVVKSQFFYPSEGGDGLWRKAELPPLPVFERGAAVLVRLGNGDVIVSRRHDHVKYLPGMLQFPGGKVDAGEKTEEAARRELAEETGVHIGSGRLERLGVWPGTKGDIPYTVEVFLYNATYLSVDDFRQVEPEKNGPWFGIKPEELLKGDAACIAGLRESVTESLHPFHHPKGPYHGQSTAHTGPQD